MSGQKETPLRDPVLWIGTVTFGALAVYSVVRDRALDAAVCALTASLFVGFILGWIAREHRG